MIRCVNCGAEIEDDSTKCPFCEYINHKGAQKQHIKNIEEIKYGIKEAKKEPARAFGRGIRKGTKIFLTALGITIVLAVLYFILLLVETRNSPKLFMTDEEKAYASAYMLTAEKQLAVAYENQDIEEMAHIYDKAYTEDRIDLYGIEHYDSAYTSSCYVKLKKDLAALDRGKINKRKAEELTYCCFYIYFREYGEDGAEIFDPILENEIRPIITERLGYTTEDMEHLKNKFMRSDDHNIIRSKLYRATKKYYKYYQ